MISILFTHVSSNLQTLIAAEEVGARKIVDACYWVKDRIAALDSTNDMETLVPVFKVWTLQCRIRASTMWVCSSRKCFKTFYTSLYLFITLYLFFLYARSMPTLAVMIGFHFMEGSSASELSRIAHYTPRLLYIKHHNLNPMRTKRLNDGKLEAGRVGLPLHLRPWKVEWRTV